MTLAANLGALVAATILAVEIFYIEPEPDGIFSGIFRPLVYWPCFFPAFVMFVLRNRTFSLCFLFLYTALAIHMYFKAAAIYGGTYIFRGHENPAGLFLIFFLFSVVCLILYAAIIGVRTAIKTASGAEPLSGQPDV